jgi:hypothetical protein
MQSQNQLSSAAKARKPRTIQRNRLAEGVPPEKNTRVSRDGSSVKYLGPVTWVDSSIDTITPLIPIGGMEGINRFCGLAV